MALCTTAITGRTRMITARFFTECLEYQTPLAHLCCIILCISREQGRGNVHILHDLIDRVSSNLSSNSACRHPTNNILSLCASTSRQHAPVTSVNTVRETGKLMSKQHFTMPSNSTLSRHSPQPAVITAILWRKDFLPFSWTERLGRHET